MNASEKSNDVETILSRMELRGPSDQLDSAIFGLMDSGDKVRHQAAVRSSTSFGFGWPVLVATGVAATMGGVLVGSFYSSSGKNPVGLTANVAHVSNSAEPTVSGLKITPVKFNIDAYEILHGHSTNVAYQDCDACHVEGQDEAFEGWFYGDGEFFKSHADAVKSKKCSSCHVSVSSPKQDKADRLKNEAKRLGLKHSDFPQSSCVSCHKAVEELPARKVKKDPEAFHHHFESVENCSNCHVGIQGFKHSKSGACKDCHFVHSDAKNLGERS
jgi:hypothetical protein